MAMENDIRVRKITYISFGVAALIVGGYMILQLSIFFPIPGVKYILMSPYLSMVIFILLTKVNGNDVLLKIGMTFGMIMMIINLYMGVTILITTLMTQLSLYFITDSRKSFYGAILFSGFTGLLALLVSKTLIGGAFKEIPIVWIIVTTIMCLISGFIGTLLAKKLMKHIIKHTYN